MTLDVELPPFLTRRDDGEIVVTGTRIVLYHFVHDYNQGYSAERIAVEFPSVPLATAHKVIAFYLENKAAVDRYAAEYGERLEELRRTTPEVNMAVLRERLAKRKLGVS